LKRLLIISPHFPPINAADHQRVRMMLPWLQEFGWEATVLAVKPGYVEGVQDESLTKTLPSDLRVVRTDAFSASWTRRLGVGSLAYRAGPYLKRAGGELLRRERFDAAFFSTTVFPIMAFGPEWKKQFGVPYILDFQDPWLSDYYDEHPEVQPPGGRLKYRFARWRARHLEPLAVRDATHILCVSRAYQTMLQRRYRDLANQTFTTLPFAASESDFSFLLSSNVRQTAFDPNDGKQHWVYVGRGGPDMALPIKALFHALNRVLSERPELRNCLIVHFIGTTYAPKGRGVKTVEPLAIEAGLTDIVSQITDRIPYFEALKCLVDADALFVPGSDDPGYTASKIYPYILAKKPLLAIFHAESSIVEILRKTKAGTLVAFHTGDTAEAISERILATGWLVAPEARRPITDWTEFKPYTAREMTRVLCEVFDKASSLG
jgi:hypothetical protein